VGDYKGKRPHSRALIRHNFFTPSLIFHHFQLINHITIIYTLQSPSSSISISISISFQCLGLGHEIIPNYEPCRYLNFHIFINYFY